MKILVINCGSSSLKYQLINMETEEVLAVGLCERIGIEGSRIKYKSTKVDKLVIDVPMENHDDAFKVVMDALTNENHGVVNS